MDARWYETFFQGAALEVWRRARRALEMSPSNADAYEDLALVHLTRGEHGAAAQAAQRAVNLSPLSAVIQNTLALTLAAAGAFDESVTVYLRSVELGATRRTYTHLFVLLTHVGRYDEARVLVRRHGLGRDIERNAAMDSAMLAVIDAHDNPRRATDAQAALSRAAGAVRDGEDRRAIALMFALLRDSERTIAAMRKCLESDAALPLLVRSRLFEHVFDDNRYRALLLAAGDALMT